MDGVETGVLLSGSAKQLHRKDADPSDFYFTLIDAAGTYTIMVLKQNSKTHESVFWKPFQNRNIRSSKILNTWWCCLCDCAKRSES